MIRDIIDTEPWYGKVKKMILGSLIEGEDDDEVESPNRNLHNPQPAELGPASPASPMSPSSSAQFQRVSRTWTDSSAQTDRRKSRGLFKDITNVLK
jgi:hypothetical protein